MMVTRIQLAMTDQPKEKNVEHALSLIGPAPPSDLILFSIQGSLSPCPRLIGTMRRIGNTI
jgi:hypothetical protein